ncbi:MAG TPA: hypothetical protein P5266_06900, partial [Candidatus Fermentibacter sp.]|nr:hypothetical protein [Candidatus Fermentibacter sp.]
PEVSMELKDWNGRAVAAERSRSGFTAVHDFSDNLVSSPRGGALPPAMAGRLRASGSPPDFDDESMKRLSERLGFYSDMQSLDHVDPMTWSVFGSLASADASAKSAWTSELYSRLGLSPGASDPSEISLWSSIRSGVNGDPAISFDASVVTCDSAVFFEASWLDGGDHPPPGGLTCRLGSLSEFVRSGGGTMRDRIVLVSLDLHKEPSLSPGRYGGVELRRMSWQYLISQDSHPFRGEINRYYDWKLSNLSS